MEAIVIKNISKKYGKKLILDDISLVIKPGIYGLLGPNGAGKTTLIRTLATVLDIEDGEIIYNNISFKNKEKIIQYIGYLPQYFSTYKKLKVCEVLEYIAILKRIDKNEINKQVQAVIKKAELEEYKNNKVESLSGGVLRRLGIAQSLLGDPPILIVDEPTVGLDPENRVEFRNILNNLSKDKIVLISTHIVEDIEATCKNIGIINKGKKIYEGSLNDFINIAKGFIWEATLSPDEYEDIKDKIKLINSKFIDEKIKIRFIKKRDINIEAVEANPSLEDAYMCIMEKNKNEF